VCDGCGADEIAWPEVERDGVVHAITMVHRREPGLILTEQPYPVADVELSSGHRLVLTTTRPCPEPPDIGEAVRIEFRSVGGVAIPAISLPELPQSEVTG
jgi:uncharacterized OB-fold protein